MRADEMSLTSFMDRPDVRRQMARDFPKPTLPVRGSIRALPCGKSAALVGTAVDYLLRFYCEHRNPAAHARRLVAEHARRLLTARFAPSSRVNALTDEALIAVAAHREHIRQTGEITRAAAANALVLAQLDSVARARRYSEAWFSEPDEDDVEDVLGIVGLFREQDWLAANSTCLLNPLFNAVPREIASADADLVIDDMLVDVKTTIRLDLSRETFNQLVGYAMLERLGGIGPPEIARPTLRYLAVYYARFGLLAKWRLTEVVDEQAFAVFVRWGREGVSDAAS